MRVITVLLVEDHEDVRHTISMLLRQDGYNVHEASNGVAAVESIRDSKPDLILTDLRMPEMDGLELARYVKSNLAYSNIPILMLSATPPLDRALLPEIKLFIQKPASMDVIRSAIAEAMDFAKK